MISLQEIINKYSNCKFVLISMSFLFGRNKCYVSIILEGVAQSTFKANFILSSIKQYKICQYDQNRTV